MIHKSIENIPYLECDSLCKWSNEIIIPRATLEKWLEIKDEIKQQFEELVKELDTMED